MRHLATPHTPAFILSIVYHAQTAYSDNYPAFILKTAIGFKNKKTRRSGL
jgi:hypothetical protein